VHRTSLELSFFSSPLISDNHCSPLIKTVIIIEMDQAALEKLRIEALEDVEKHAKGYLIV